MNVRHKRLVRWLVAGVLLGAVGMVAALWARFDAASIKQAAAAAVERQTGRKLTIEGDLALGLWPNVAIEVGRTTLSEPDGHSRFAQFERARLAVAVLPLLSQRIVVRDVAIDGLSASLVRKPDGTLNFADLLAGPPPQKVGAGETAGERPPPSIEIAAVRIDNVRLDWHDAQQDRHVSLTDADLSSGPIRFADGRGSIAALTLNARFDATRLKLQATVDRFTPLAMNVDMVIDQIDVDRYLPPPSAAATRPAPRRADRAAAPIDLDWLADLDLTGGLTIGRLSVAKLKAEEVRAQFVVRHGRLDLAPLSARLYEGRLNGALSVEAGSRRIAAKQSLAGVQIGALLSALAGEERLAGRGTVEFDVVGQGADVGAFKQSLAGSARIELSDGAIQGIDMGRMLREAKSLLKGGRPLAMANDTTRKTDFSALSARFRIAAGVAHNDDLLVQSPLLRLTGAGDLDIGRSRIDYLLKTSLVATGTGQGGKALDEVKSVTVPVRLRGPLAQPDWQVEFAGLSGEAGKAKVAAKVEQKKEALKQQVDDKLKGKLKGLLK